MLLVVPLVLYVAGNILVKDQKLYTLDFVSVIHKRT